MPTETAPVGSMTLPLPTGGADSDIRDVTLDGLIDFVGFLIKQNFDQKLSEMGGPRDSSAITDACPVANRFPFNHQGAFVRAALPSLWAWESASRDSDRFATIHHSTVERDITMHYIFESLSVPSGILNRSGLMSGIGKTVQRAAQRGRHPLYGYNGAPPGEPLFKSLNLMGWSYISGTEGLMVPAPGGGRNTQNTANVGYELEGYPTYQIQLRVWERIEPPQCVDGDTATDGTISIELGNDVTDTIPIAERVLEAPDE